MQSTEKDIFEKEEPWVIVDPKTGQIIDNFYEGDKIIRGKEDDGYIHNFMKGVCFVKIFDEAIPRLTQKLTNAELKIVISIIPYVSYDDNIIRKDGKRLNIGKLGKELNLTYEAARRHIKSLNRKGVLFVGQVGCLENPNKKTFSIVANPFIYTRGTKEVREIAGLFEGSGWDDLYKKQV